MQKKRRIGLIAVLTALIALSSLPAAADVPEAYSKSSLERLVYMPNGEGPFQYYAQNDPIWDKSIFEAPKADFLREFGDGGCNPTALAMVVASLVPTDYLNLLGMNAANGRTFSLCSCSVNKYYCHEHRKDADHLPSTLLSGEDFREVLPLALADYATGNNTTRTTYRVPGKRSGGNGGTSHNMFAPVAQLYGLSYDTTRDMDQVLTVLDRGGLAIALCNSNAQIFSGSVGHYIVICAYDDEYIYIMDPYVRDKYKKDKYHIIEPVDTGIKKVKRESVGRVGFSTFALFEAAPASYYASLPVLTNPYVGRVGAGTADASVSSPESPVASAK